MLILNIILFITLILLIVFKTEAWLEYCKLFHLERISDYEDYELKKSNDLSLNYTQYLRQYHDCFLIRLVTCPICLSVWLGIIAALITWTLPYALIYIIGSLLLFSMINKLL